MLYNIDIDKIRANIEARGYDLLDIWVADSDSAGVPYTPDYQAGDLLLELKGKDAGSVSWLEVL